MANASLLDIRFAGVQDLSSGPGDFDFLVPNLGGNPKAAIFMLVNSASGVNNGLVASQGFTDGVNQACIVTRDRNSVGTSDCSQMQRDDCLAFETSHTVDTPIVDGKITFNTWLSTPTSGGDSSGVRVTLAGTVGGPQTLACWVIAGESVEAHVDTEGLPLGDTVVTSPGFRPKVVFGLMVGGLNTWGTHGMFSSGIAIDKGLASLPDQGCASFASEDGNTNSNTRSGSHEGLLGTTYMPTSGGLVVAGDTVLLKDFDTNGFTLNHGQLGTANLSYLALGFDDSIDYDLEHVQSPSAIGVESFTGPGFEAGYLFSLAAFAATPNAVQVGASFTLGVTCWPHDQSTPANQSHSRAARSQNTLGTTRTRSNSHDGVHLGASVNRADDAAVVNWDARNPLGYDLDWTFIHALAQNRYYWTLAIENVPARVGPGGIVGGEAFGTPTILPGVVTVVPGGVVTSEAFGAPTILPGVVTVVPGGVVTSEAFGAPTVLPGVGVVVPGGIVTGEAFGLPELSSVATLGLSSVGSQEMFGTPTVLPGVVVVVPGDIPSEETFGLPELLAGVLAVQPGGIPSEETIVRLSLLPGVVTVVPGGIASGEAFGLPELLAGVLAVQPGDIPSEETFGLPELITGSAFVVVPGIASGEALGLPNLFAVQDVTLGGIASGEVFGLPELTQGLLLVQPGGIVGGEAFGAPTILPGVVTVVPGGVVTSEAFGLPELTQQLVVRPVAIVSAEAFGTPSIAPGAVLVTMEGIESSEEFSAPFLVGGDITIVLAGIPSGEALPNHFLLGGFIPVTLKKKIHDALMALAKGGTFVAVDYDANTCTLEQGSQVAVQSAVTNEISSAYGRDTRHGRKLRDDRVAWRWQLILRFHQEVTTEIFEEYFLENPITIPRDLSDASSRSAIVSLLDANYDHPPQQGASNGTEATFTVSVEVCRA